MKGYKLACCDCGLVHEMDFKVVRVTKRHKNGNKTVMDAPPNYEVMFQARRSNRSTGQVRRHNKGKSRE